MRKYISFLIAIFPLLHIYMLPIGVPMSIFQIVVLLTYFYIFATGINIKYDLPNGFTLYWVYIAVIYFLFASRFRVGLFIPGGLSFVMWILTFWLGINFLDFRLFRKYYRGLFTLCALFLVIQEISYFTMGYRPLYMLPLPFYGLDASLIIDAQAQLDRSSSFFLEPSHFAQFSLPLLALELFCPSKSKLLSGYSLYIILVLLLLRSGIGIAGIFVLMLIRIFYYYRTESAKNKIFATVIGIPLIISFILLYSESEAGQYIMERAISVGMSEDAESSTRLYRGWIFFLDLPIQHKLFGCDIEQLVDLAVHSPHSYLYSWRGTYRVYLNGIQQIMVINGIIGAVLFTITMLKLYKGKSILSKSLIIVFFVLMFIGDIYIGQMMLITMLVPFLESNRNLKFVNYRHAMTLMA